MHARLTALIGIGVIAMAMTGCGEPAADAPDGGGVTSGWATLTGEEPLVIAHRGASGQRPEHTEAAYELAIAQGADVIEPDLVMTRDGVLVVRHDLFLSLTTDVASRPQFADRRRPPASGIMDPNLPEEDWWVEDFTLAELRTLRTRQHQPGRSDFYDGLFGILTFEEVLDIALSHGVMIAPETKEPGYFASIGLDPFEPLVRILRERGLDGADAPVFIQSFEPEILIRLRAAVETPLVQLVFPLNWLDPSAPAIENIPLETIAGFADWVGPNKELIIRPDGERTDFIERAHALGLRVQAWTFRDDRPPADGADPVTELARIYTAGADAVFTDYPATAVAARDAMRSGARPPQ